MFGLIRTADYHVGTYLLEERTVQMMKTVTSMTYFGYHIINE